jgi:ATP-dependent RNA helicase DDX19/DBP5
MYRADSDLGKEKSPAKSLADRISMGGEEAKKTEEKGEGDKASSLTSTTTPITTGDEGEKNGDEKDAKEQETNLIQNRYQVAVKLQDLQADPNSPLYSVKSFEELGL